MSTSLANSSSASTSAYSAQVAFITTPNAGGHLPDRVERSDTGQRPGFDGTPEPRKFGQRGGHARQMRRTSGAGDDELEAGRLGALGESEQPVRGAMGRYDAFFAANTER